MNAPETGQFNPRRLAGIRLDGARPVGGSEEFVRLATSLTRFDDHGTLLAQLELAGDAATVEWLWPFSWGAADRGVISAIRTLSVGDRLCLHAGPYGTADAVAHRESRPMIFPTIGEGHRYRPDHIGPPQPSELHQDASAWTLVEVGDRCLVLAWEYSGHLVTEVGVEAGTVAITSRLPADTFSPAQTSAVRRGPGPDGWLALIDGGLDEGAAALRQLVEDEIVKRPTLADLPGSPEFPCIVANSWGVEENTSTERILGMMTATAAFGAEIFVVDKGWERAVGD